MSGQIAEANGLSIWYETFGRAQDPTLLLIMGACSQAILWPTNLCKQFADRGFYVIRYDHRDAGLSTCFDFDRQPYDYLDMTRDAVGLLDFLGIGSAHLFGLSTGGMLGQLMAAHFPSRVQSLTLIATSCEIAPLNRALQGGPLLDGPLSNPTADYLAAMDEFLNRPPQSEEEKLLQRMAIWQLLNGSIFPLKEESERPMHWEFLCRLRHPAGLANHIKASFRSEEIVRNAPAKIRTPTLVLQGTEDPIFPIDHGKKLAESITGSTYHLLKGFGHVPNPHFFDEIVEAVATLESAHRQ
jgi:pimeloyl-ACP methyl ester carboxylesterase